MLVALQAHCIKAQRAAVIANRNFLRSSGGAVGLALAAQVLQSSLKANLPPRLAAVARSTYAIPPLDPADTDLVRNAYMAAIRTVFIVLAPMMGMCLALCLLIKDRGLQRPDERAAAEELERQNEVAQVAELVSNESLRDKQDAEAQNPVADTVPTKTQPKE